MAEPIAPEADGFPERLRRRCLWALLVVLPAAFALNGYESFLTWWRGSELFERQVRAGEAGTLAGAEWRLGTLQQVAERRDGSAIMLLELEAVVRDAQQLATLPCRVALADGEGRRWQPTFLTPSEVRRMPERRGATTTSCNSAISSKPAAGATLRITESFVVPRAAAGDVAAVLSLPAERPRYLRFLRKD